MLDIRRTVYDVLGRTLSPSLPEYFVPTGRIFYVADESDTDSLDSRARGWGNFDQQFATLEHAVERCVDNRGDVIVIDGKVFSNTASDQTISLDKAGITLMGMAPVRGEMVERSMIDQAYTDPPATAMNPRILLTIDAPGIRLSNLFIRHIASATGGLTGHMCLKIQGTGEGTLIQRCVFENRREQDANAYHIYAIADDVVVEDTLFVEPIDLIGPYDAYNGGFVRIQGDRNRVSRCWFLGCGPHINLDSSGGSDVQDLIVENCLAYAYGDNAALTFIDANITTATGILWHNQAFYKNNATPFKVAGQGQVACIENYETNDLTKSGSIQPARVV